MRKDENANLHAMRTVKCEAVPGLSHATSLCLRPMNAHEYKTARTLTQREVMDLVRAGLILAMTVAAAVVVPPQVFGA
jgi:hypothetical protein